MIFNIFFKIIIFKKQSFIFFFSLDFKFVKTIQYSFSQRIILILMEIYFLFQKIIDFFFSVHRKSIKFFFFHVKCLLL